jgi:hypothetical protein
MENDKPDYSIIDEEYRKAADGPKPEHVFRVVESEQLESDDTEES